jgi:hypothetical protein
LPKPSRKKTKKPLHFCISGAKIRFSIKKHRKMLRIFLIILWFALLLPNLSAQVMRTNEKGQQIIVFPDGRIQLFSEFDDQADPNQKPPQAQTNEQKFPVLDVTIEPLENGIPVTAEDLRRIAERKLQLTKEAARIAQQRAEEASRQKKALEEQHRLASRKEGDDQKQLVERLRVAQQSEMEAQREALIAANEARKVEEITRRGAYLEEYQRTQQQKKQQAKQYERLDLTAASSYESLLSYDFLLPFGGSGDALAAPPSPPCSYAYEGKDDRGRYRRDLTKQLLFTHTEEKLRPFLHGQQYLSCEGYFTVLGGYRYLSLEFTFAYPNAREAYGFIEKGSYLLIKLLNDQFVTLFSGKMDTGAYDTETGLLTYRVHYPIDQSQINILKRSEASSVLVSWSSGYEEYEVYELGFFINQIQCLE